MKVYILKDCWDKIINYAKAAYHGEPAKLSEEYRKVFGTNSIDSCNYEPDGHNDYCDVQECTFRAQCNSYKLSHPEPVTQEQAEQMTLQWATRMGGVNTSTGNIHGGEQFDVEQLRELINTDQEE